MKLAKQLALVIMLALLLALAAPFTAAAWGGPDKAEPGGGYLKFIVDVNKSDDDGTFAYNYFIIKNIEYVIQEGDILYYDVFLEREEKSWGHLDGWTSPNGGETKNNLRDNSANITVTDGSGLHTGTDISDVAYQNWYRRGYMFEGDLPGQLLGQIQVSMHADVPENNYQAVVLYDNIVIVNKGEVKLVIFQNVGDVDPADTENSFRLSHARGSTSNVEVHEFTAEDMARFDALVQAKAEEAASKEAAKASEDLSRAESREQASIEASKKLAEEEAAAAAEAAAESDASEAAGGSDSKSDSDDGPNMILIICIAGGGLVLVIVIILIAVTGKKKKPEDDKK